jgi:hypothetical protein
MSTDEPKAIDLRQAAAEEAAGELTSAEQAAFSEIAKQDPAIAGECAFWRCLRSRLTTAQPDPLWAPGRSFREGILSRLDWEGDSSRRPRAMVIPLPTWLAAGLAAGLGVLVGFVLFTKPAPPGDAALSVRAPAPGATIAYQDDGGALVSPESQQVRWASYMPLTLLHEIETTRPHGPSAESAETMKPWLGLWTKPVDLETHGVKGGQGHLVLRVAHDGPCHQAGIRPGDVILSIDHRKVMTPHCIADHLVNAKPGDDVLIEFWSAQTASVSLVTVTLGCVCE